MYTIYLFFFFSSRRRHTRSTRDWSSDVCSSDLALAKQLLRELGTEVLSHVVSVGHVRLERAVTWKEIQIVCANLDSPLRCVDAATEERMKAEVDFALRNGDTVGGVFEVVAHNVVPGLGTRARWA